MYTGNYAELNNAFGYNEPTTNYNIVFRSKEVFYQLKFKFDYAYIPSDMQTLHVGCHYVTSSSRTEDTPYNSDNAENDNQYWIGSVIAWNRPGLNCYSYESNIGYNSGFDTKEEVKDFIKRHSNITDDDVMCWMFMKNIYEQDYELGNLSHTFNIDYNNFKYSRYNKLEDFESTDFVYTKQFILSTNNRSYYISASLEDWTELSRYTFSPGFISTLGRRAYPFAIKGDESYYQSLSYDDNRYVKKYNGSDYEDVLNMHPIDFCDMPNDAFVCTDSKTYKPINV